MVTINAEPAELAEKLFRFFSELRELCVD